MKVHTNVFLTSTNFSTTEHEAHVTVGTDNKWAVYLNGALVALHARRDDAEMDALSFLNHLEDTEESRAVARLAEVKKILAEELATSVQNDADRYRRALALHLYATLIEKD
jgi:hypothetical protein